MFFISFKKRLGRLATHISPLAQKPPELFTAVQTAHGDWRQALNNFNHYTDPEMINYAALNIKTAERRYIALLARARREGFTAWPRTLKPVCTADARQMDALVQQ